MSEDEGLLARLRSFYDLGGCLLDEMELEAWVALFAGDARYMVISRENFDQGLPHATIYCDGRGMMEDRVTAIRQALIFEERALRHMISCVRINRREGDRLHTQANFMMVESLVEHPSAIVMVGRYLDVLTEREGGFTIHSRQCVFDNYWTPRSVIVPI